MAHSVIHAHHSNEICPVQVEQKEEMNQHIMKRCNVFGYGVCYGIYVNGNPMDGTGRNKRLVGKIEADLCIRNDYPMPPTRLGDILSGVIGCRIKIEDLETGQLYTFHRTRSITYVTLLNFSGVGFIGDYHKGWGPNRAIFYLRGTADVHFPQ